LIKWLLAIGVWLLAIGIWLKVKKDMEIVNKIHDFSRPGI
jgi:hypothetical protein